MKNKVNPSILIILIFIVNTLVAQESVTRKLDDFYSLKATGDMRVEIFPSDKTYAEVFYAGTTPEKVITEVKNFELNIRLRTDTPKDAKIRIVLYYTKLHNMAAFSNAGIISNEPLKGDKVEFSATRAGKINLVLEVNEINVDVTQGGHIEFAGKVTKQNVNSNTGGTYLAYDLEASDSYVKASAGAIAKLRASRIIDANANTKGFIGYKGDPDTVHIKTNLGGEISSIKEQQD